MSDVVIKVENLSKRYRLGLIGGKTLREDVQRWWAKLRGQPDPLLKVDQLEKLQASTSLSAPGSSLHAQNSKLQAQNSEPTPPGSSLPAPSSSQSDAIWALKDINFEVKRGEILGIIGKNGAGKSTLLKIISKITAPTTGEIKIKGRVGSLLEVGTGFHPELTGRENTYLNGAILGMRKSEVDRKFDEIVDFSEIEKFIDTPVKRYSSGMYVRLAFAVAAHLDPEILVVDEVLAVGDVTFQKKCLGKMDKVAKEGRTVLFVSHNMSAVQRLCSTCIWLHDGQIRLKDLVEDVVTEYLNLMSNLISSKILPANSSVPLSFRKIQVSGQEFNKNGSIEFSEPINIEIDYDINRSISSAHVACFIHNIEGVCVFGSGDADINQDRLGTRTEGSYKACFQVPPRLLGEGIYTITVTSGIPYVHVYDRHESIVQFQIIDKTSCRRKWQHKRRPGILGIELPWVVQKK
ncbi:ABC transporter ATP-binding protein [Thermodesulfobacteriota bacterium]